MRVWKLGGGFALQVGFVYLSVALRRKCLFARRNGYAGVNLFGLNFFMERLKK